MYNLAHSEAFSLSVIKCLGKGPFRWGERAVVFWPGFGVVTNHCLLVRFPAPATVTARPSIFMAGPMARFAILGALLNNRISTAGMRDLDTARIANVAHIAGLA